MKTKFLFLAVILMTVTACGIKPAYVDPPEGVEHNTFPNKYPQDTLSEPKPGLENKNVL